MEKLLQVPLRGPGLISHDLSVWHPLPALRGPLLSFPSRAIMTKLNKSTRGCRSEPAEMGTVRSGPWKPDLDHANVGRWAFARVFQAVRSGSLFIFTFYNM